jgi:hypothetical protein
LALKEKLSFQCPTQAKTGPNSTATLAPASEVAVQEDILFKMVRYMQGAVPSLMGQYRQPPTGTGVSELLLFKTRSLRQFTKIVLDGATVANTFFMA